MQISTVLLATLAYADSEALAQPLTLEYQETVTRRVEGATAAFSLDPAKVGASGRDGQVTLVGRAPGSTHVIVIIGPLSQSLEVVVKEPPVNVLAGMPAADSSTVATTLADVRYNSEPGIFQGSFRSSRREGRRTVSLWLGGAMPLESADAAPFSLPLAAYSVTTPTREITIFDRVVSNSPLTVSRSNVRGLHLQNGPWRLHAGYSFFANFEHLLLPTSKEAVAGIGYQYRLRSRGTLTPNFYYFAPESSNGRKGSIGTLLYEALPSKHVRLAAEVGVGRKLGGAFELEVDRVNRRVWGKIRFAPVELPALTADQQSGRQIDGGWTNYGKRATVNASVSSRAYALAPVNYTSHVASVDLQYRVADAFTVHGGPAYSVFHTSARPDSLIRSLALPIGAQFTRREYGAGFDYQFSKETHSDLAGHLIRPNVNAAWRGFRLSAYGERRTQTPTAGRILTTAPWLQQMLDRMGLTANTPEQLSELLRLNAEVAAYGYANNLTLHITPVRSRAGATLAWSGSSGLRPQLFVSTLFNRDEEIDRTRRDAMHTVSYSQRLGKGTEIFSNWSMLCRADPPGRSPCRPVFSVSLRQTLNSAPRVLLPERHGSIEGTVFRDEQARGTYVPGLPTVGGIEVVLDGVRRTFTDDQGRYRFEGVPYGRHKLEVQFPSSESFFFTTPSPAEVETGATVDFGISTLLSGLRGAVRSDFGIGLADVVLRISSADRHLKVQTLDDGTFVVRGLPHGTYDVSVDPGSVPPGYVLDDGMSRRLLVPEAAQATATFVLRASRHVTGSVRAFDRNAGAYVPVSGATVALQRSGQRILTDANGRYMFRDVAPGEHIVSATYHGREHTIAFEVLARPALMTDVDISMVDVAPAPAPPNRAETTGARAEPRVGSFAVQVAALKNVRRARALVDELTSTGLPAYLVEPVPTEPHALYRVRVGRYASRDDALDAARALEKTRGERPWVLAATVE